MTIENISSPTLQIEGVKKKFGYREVLKGADLSLYPGKLTLLLGRNGAGKSTLLKIICGTLPPSEGNVYIQGQKTKENPELLRKSIGLISHASQLYQELTAKENLHFFGKLRSIKNLKKQVEQVLEMVGLKDFSDTAIKTFSSGMLKRLSIGRLILFNPTVILLDEPFDGLDQESTQFFLDFLKDFRNSGGTILMITHQLESSFSFCDKIAILQNGKTAYFKDRKEVTLEQFLTDYRKLQQSNI